MLIFLINNQYIVIIIADNFNLCVPISSAYIMYADMYDTYGFSIQFSHMFISQLILPSIYINIFVY